MRTESRTLPASRGHTLVIQAVIVLVIAAVVIVPIVLLTHAKSRQKARVIEQTEALITVANQAKEELKRGYDAIAATRRLRHSERIKRDYDQEFAALFRRFYRARKTVFEGDDDISTESLIVVKREVEDFVRRITRHRDRILELVALRDAAEGAIQTARSYQTAIHLIRDHADFESNKFILPQLEEADRQLGTAMNFAISGIQQFPEDLRGDKTPVLIKTGIAQIHRVIADVDGLFRRVAKADEVTITMPDQTKITLDTYRKRFLEESARDRAESAAALAEGSSEGAGGGQKRP